MKKCGTPFWHDIIEDSMLSHLEPATTLATRILQKMKKKLLKLKRKPCNSAAIAPVRFVEENSLKIIKFSLVSGHFWRKFPHFSKKNGSDSASPRIPGKIWNYGIDFLHFWWILAPPGDPKNHENSWKSQPGAPKCSQLAPRTLPGPSRDRFFMIFDHFCIILATKKAWKKPVILFLCSLLRGLIW